MTTKLLPKDLAAPKPYRILVADDHAIVRRGVRALLELEPGVEVCHEAADGFEALEYVKKHKPDMVLLDLTMPEMNGLDAVREIRAVSPETDVLILTMHFSEDVARDAFRSGANGYVLKSDADLELLHAVRQVQRHKPFFTGKLALSMVDNYIQNPLEGEATEENPLPGTPLTAREVQILQMLAGGMSNKQIAPAIGLSIRTVESHRNHIMHKMKFGSFSELMRFAIRNHLVEP
ncbi:MAG TPA: response regulator transcription factor [Candidatus Acidoferrales bacterium]